MDEQNIQDLMDGRLSSDESRRLLTELRNSNRLGELLFSEAASAMLDSAEVVARDLSPEEAMELKSLQNSLFASKNSHGYTIEDEQMPLAAESETPYGK